MGYLLAIAIGLVAGMRTMTAPTAISWAAYVGWIDLSGSPLAFMGSSWTAWIFTVLAIGELIADQLPTTPSRKTPGPFGARIASGALCGASLGVAMGSLGIGAVAGVVGAVIGTLGGAAGRAALAQQFGRDRPAAFIEDGVAIVAAVAIILACR